MSKQFVIPVAFEVYAEDETQAATALKARLLEAHVVPLPSEDAAQVECWWFPNHPQVDGSDDEGNRLAWVGPHAEGTR